RWIGGAQAASIFVRVQPGLACMMCLTIAYPTELERRLQVQVCGRPIETWVSRDEAGRAVIGGFVPDDLTRAHDARLWVGLACLDDDGEPAAGLLSLARVSLSQESQIVVPVERLLVEKDALLEQRALRVSQLEQLFAEQAASLEQERRRASQFEQLLAEKEALREQPALRISRLERLLAEKDAALEQQVLQVSELERILQATHQSRSWKVTAPLRKMMNWLRR